MREIKEQKETGTLYGTLFTNYDSALFEDSVELFFERHKKWGIDLDWFKDKVCLDAGCGGGRFVVALSRLGAREVKGIDISEEAVSAANKRVRERNLSQAEATVASVLAIPYPDNYFDYVVCSGVIHHTPDPYKGFQELARVLKPNGKLFFSVYGAGGLAWFLQVDIWRFSICKIVPFSIMEKIWKFVGVPANKRYNYLDNLYVPYCFRYTEHEIRRWLTQAQFHNLKRVKFERYDYEKVSSRILYGEGWIQFYADKK
ncbi:MAG: methyltransferase domain-containing protein [bacterium]|nr:methyltransferase domain-containing protein [bacterium]